MLQSGLSVMGNEVSERTCITIATCALQNRNREPSFSGQASKIGIKFVPFQKTRYILKFVDIFVVEELFSCESRNMEKSNHNIWNQYLIFVGIVYVSS